MGFLSFNVEQDLYNPETDNPEKTICNSLPVGGKGNEKNRCFRLNRPLPPPAKLKIAFNGQLAVRAGGAFPKVFTASLLWN